MGLGLLDDIGILDKRQEIESTIDDIVDNNFNVYPNLEYEALPQQF